jgi:hypothetical protein
LPIHSVSASIIITQKILIYFYHLSAISFQQSKFCALLPRLVRIYNVGLALYPLGRHCKVLNQILPALSLVVALGGGDHPPPTHNNVDVIFSLRLQQLPTLGRCNAPCVPGPGLPPHPAWGGRRRHRGGGAPKKRWRRRGGCRLGFDVEDLLPWIKGKTLASASGGLGLSDRRNELRFRLHLYRSRMLFSGLPPHLTGVTLIVATIIRVILGAHLMCAMGGKRCTIGDVPPALLVGLLVVTIIPAGRLQLPPCSFIMLSGQCVILFWLIRSKATFPPSSMGYSCACDAKKPLSLQLSLCWNRRGG